MKPQELVVDALNSWSGDKGLHSNIICTAIFVLGQDETQGNSGWSKVKLPFGWTRVNLAFYVEFGYCTS